MSATSGTTRLFKLLKTKKWAKAPIAELHTELVRRGCNLTRRSVGHLRTRVNRERFSGSLPDLRRKA